MTNVCLFYASIGNIYPLFFFYIFFLILVTNIYPIFFLITYEERFSDFSPLYDWAIELLVFAIPLSSLRFQVSQLTNMWKRCYQFITQVTISLSYRRCFSGHEQVRFYNFLSNSFDALITPTLFSATINMPKSIRQESALSPRAEGGEVGGLKSDFFREPKLLRRQTQRVKLQKGVIELQNGVKLGGWKMVFLIGSQNCYGCKHRGPKVSLSQKKLVKGVQTSAPAYNMSYSNQLS